MDRKMVNFIKEQYPPGTRIRLNSMEDPYHPILPGTEGEVDFVDNEGQIFMKWDNGRTLPLIPGEDSFTVLPPKLTTLKLYMPLTADLYERNEYGDFDDSSTLLEGRELRGYQNQITAALVKNRMPEETERGIMHWYDEADSVDRKVRSAVFTVAASGYPHGFGSNITAFANVPASEIAGRAVENWRNSPGHFQTMVDPDCDTIGVGISTDEGGTICFLFVGDPNAHNPYA